MNKIKFFFIIASLLLATAGLFAGRTKFTSGTVYASDGITYCRLTPSSINLFNLTISSVGMQATITDCNGNLYGLYSFTAPSTYNPLYFIACN